MPQHIGSAPLDYSGTISFPALKGVMGNRNFYVVIMPLSQVPRLLQISDADELSPEARAQRRIVLARIPDITNYILNHEDDWLFSSLTASFDSEEQFVASDTSQSMGMLHLPLEAKLQINDGQHRTAAIERALRVDPMLARQTISVVLFPAENLERNQQMFSDLNRTAQKTSRSLNIMYDHRDPINEIALALEGRVPLLRGRVEKERQSIAVRSSKLITLSALYDMCREYLGSTLDEKTSETQLQKIDDDLGAKWQLLTDLIPEWTSITSGELRPAEARTEFVSVHAVFFYAIGGVLRKTSTEQLSNLRNIDWRRTNPEWQGICMIGPDIVTRRQTRSALREYILFRLGVNDAPPQPAIS